MAARSAASGGEGGKQRVRDRRGRIGSAMAGVLPAIGVCDAEVRRRLEIAECSMA